ncbi:MAG TPA: alpha/beta hydrolase [Elusimicrobia bacterium]|nr:alpha/beta hydrolase [Elusimicrobiota bacterium]
MLLKTERGPFAVRDFGGKGRALLLVHGTGHDLEVWTPLAERLKGAFRLAAFDLRGHGQTPLDSADPEQYWRDIGAVSAALGMERPLLAGHSTGGYAVTAFAADGGDCSGIIVLDGFVLDGRKTPEEAHAWHLPKEQLWGLFRYGWKASPAELDAYVAEVCAKAPGDWLNDGLDAKLVAAFTRGAFLERDGAFLRRPSMEEIALVGAPDPGAKIYPSVDVYDRVRVPAGFVLAQRGLYGNRREDLLKVVGAGSGRGFLELDCGHNVHMQKPEQVAEFILRRFT